MRDDGYLGSMRGACLSWAIPINQLAEFVMHIAEKALTIRHIKGSLGVRGRNSDNRPISEELGRHPSQPLREGLEETYAWVAVQVEKAKAGQTARAFCAKGEN